MGIFVISKDQTFRICATFLDPTKFSILVIHLIIAVPKENDIFQIAIISIRDGRLAIFDLKNEFCWGTFHIKKVLSDPGKIGRSGKGIILKY
jgi:hypothetical protein